MNANNKACIPTIPEDVFGDGRWLDLHKRFESDAKEKEPEVVFIGDSIIAYLSYLQMWDTHFGPLHSVNFGIGGERVENVLWRVINGEMEQMRPKAVVILVGTNNHGDSAENIAEGIVEIIDTIAKKQPQAYIITLSLLPRGMRNNPLRERNESVNKILKSLLHSKPKTQFLNIDPGFVQQDGTISHHDMWDYLHLTQSGYLKSFEPLSDLLQQILNESNKESAERNFDS